MECFIKSINNERIILDNQMTIDIVVKKGIQYFNAQLKEGLVVNIPIEILSQHMFKEHKLEKYLRSIMHKENTNLLDYEKWLLTEED